MGRYIYIYFLNEGIMRTKNNRMRNIMRTRKKKKKKEREENLE